MRKFEKLCNEYRKNKLYNVLEPLQLYSINT